MVSISLKGFSKTSNGAGSNRHGSGTSRRNVFVSASTAEVLVTSEDDLSFTSEKSQPERGNGRTYNLTKLKGQEEDVERQLSNNRQTKAGKMRSRFDGRGSENNEASRKNFNLDDSDEAEDVTPQRKDSSDLQARTRTVPKGRIYLDPGGSYDSSDSGRHNDDEPSSEDSVGRELDLRYNLKEERGRMKMNEHYE